MKKGMVGLLILTAILISSCGPEYGPEPPVDYKAEFLNQMGRSSEILRLNRAESQISPGGSDVLLAGIRNTANETRCFKANIKCIRSLKETSCPPQSKEWFQLPAETNIAGGSIDLLETKIQIPLEKSPETYLMQYEIYQSKIGDCINPFWESLPYDSKKFFLKVEESKPKT
jgi:hypothetical protein